MMCDRKEIIDFPGYFITIDGRVYSKKFKTIRELKLTTNHKGYLLTVLSKNNHRKGCFIHRLIVQHFKPEIWNSKLQVNHIDGDKLNNNLTNLEMVTNKENMQHAKENGLTRHLNGSALPHSKISEQQAIYIKNSLKTRKARDIAKELNISDYIVYHISLGRTWRHV